MIWVKKTFSDKMCFQKKKVCFAFCRAAQFDQNVVIIYKHGFKIITIVKILIIITIKYKKNFTVK